MVNMEDDRNGVDELLDDNNSNNSRNIATQAAGKAKNELRDKAAKEIKNKGNKNK